MSPKEILDKTLLISQRSLGVFLIITSIGGIILSFIFAPDDWGIIRTVFAGILGGFGVGLIVVTSRLTGAFEDDGGGE